ncbi:hypothetical protein GCM10010965_08240 [Caldalkalibacillus thermarum]|uniref:hypothetical protein n=1 Tax=Caldalkalibacillus thermarum TaxID=296745 RepID=UPI00166DA14B|nr:hypothetical protein [Caldalkalibacillus thermarum]GGK17540.1 hypothetical protein GCM10010965_08240 [Caldalkalibacillus thermarum]
MVRKIRGAFAYAAVTAAVVFLVFQFLIQSDDQGQFLHQADQGLERTEQPVQHEETEEPGAMNHHDSHKEG